MKLFPETDYHQLMSAIASFPGNDRRFEKLEHNLYSDYGHHPKEIAATLQMAREVSDSVVLVYQPHQNLRQHMIKDEYTDELFADAEVVYWLPTYLSREDPELALLSTVQLSSQIDPARVSLAKLDDSLWQDINRHRASGQLVLAMGAGNIDSWLRSKLRDGNE